MRTKNLILIFFTLILLSQGCESNLPIDQKDQAPLITVNGILTQNIPGSVEITKSVSYSSTSDKVETVENAFVQLLGNNNVVDTFKFKEIVTNSSLYVKQISHRYVSANNYLPEPGVNYKLQISVPGYDEIISSTLIPPPVQIISVDTNTTYIINGSYPQKVLECTVKFHDPLQEKNYYKVEISGGSNIEKNLYYLDANLLGIKFNYNTPGFISLEEEEGIQFVNEVFTSDATFDGEIKEIKVLIILGYSEIFGLTKAPAKTNRLNIKFYSINEEYYKYSESYFKQLIKKINIFSEPIMVYSNISNGVGIFSGESVAIDSSIILP